jgi:hypothetical protein
MRALREQPRVTFAKIILAFALIGTGVAMGVLLDGEGGDRVQATQTRLASAQHSLTAREGELGVAHERIERTETVLRRERRNAGVLARANRRLRRELRTARRAGRQARQQR